MKRLALLSGIATAFLFAGLACTSGAGGSGAGTGGDSGQAGQGGAKSGNGGSTGTGGSGTGGDSATGGTAGATAGAGGNSGTGGSAGASGAGGGSGGAAGAKGGAGGGAGAGGAAGGGSGGAAGSAAMLLTSSAYMNGMTIPQKYTCAGTNVSPPLAWTAGPAGTMSYAIVFQDMSNMLVHWVIWDIPGNVTSLPEMLANTSPLANPAGAKQAAFQNGIGYRGPCPGGNLHTYVFTLYAMTAASINFTGTAAAAAARIQMAGASLAKATLSGTSNGQ